MKTPPHDQMEILKNSLVLVLYTSCPFNDDVLHDNALNETGEFVYAPAVDDCINIDIYIGRPNCCVNGYRHTRDTFNYKFHTIVTR